ncbi:MAG TPA: HyaD/HybD family hydrogenase maturation endopeptidase [Bryobacteraceae bacterium]|jgi:hydrogenase maturation protease|nr:HyaD/HybD family hydrogenase maturation endopeptidase [Bryobacteraceae bacterium]
MIHEQSQTLALGLGNLVRSDDGLGVHAIQRLTLDPRVPSDVVLMDGGTQGLSLLPYISAYQRLLVVDALDVGEAPGTLVRVEGKALKNLPGKASVHQLGFADLLVALELLGELPEEIILLGAQPLSIEWSTELTPPLQAALGPLLDAVIQQLETWRANQLVPRNILVRTG